jgi:hypothetical protein
MKTRLLNHFCILSAFVIPTCASALSAPQADDRAFNNWYNWYLTVRDATVGGEPEFTEPKMFALDFGKDLDDQARPENRAFRDQWAKIMRERCKDLGYCKVKGVKKEYWEDDKPVHNKVKFYRVTYDDGWWFEVDVDVGVIEVRHKPSTIKTLERLESRMQRDIWDVANGLGLSALPGTAAHSHIGLEATFGDDIRKVRNYLVDCVNHQELGLLMTDDLSNAPPLSKLKRSQFVAFKKIIAEVDSGKIKSITALEDQLEKRVFNVTYDMKMLSEWDRPQKYQATNTTRLNKKVPVDQRTVEHRDQPGMPTAFDYIRLQKLRVYRAAFINSQDGLIKLRDFNPDASPTALMSNFYGYISECNLVWGNYRRFIRKKFKTVMPRDYIPTQMEEDDSTVCVRQKVREIFR